MTREASHDARSTAVPANAELFCGGKECWGLGWGEARRFCSSVFETTISGSNGMGERGGRGGGGAETREEIRRAPVMSGLYVTVSEYDVEDDDDDDDNGAKAADSTPGCLFR